jgi:hypothetical protein
MAAGRKRTAYVGDAEPDPVKVVALSQPQASAGGKSFQYDLSHCGGNWTAPQPLAYATGWLKPPILFDGACNRANVSLTAPWVGARLPPSTQSETATSAECELAEAQQQSRLQVGFHSNRRQDTKLHFLKKVHDTGQTNC